MKKKYLSKSAFSVIELVIFIVVVVTIALAFIPFLFSNRNGAIIISKWQNAYEDALYTYKVYKLQDIDIKNLYLFFDMDKTESSKKKLKKYYYTFFNGKKIPEESIYYVKELFVLKNRMILGLNFDELKCVNEKNCEGVIIFDVNGFERPNRFGKDIFGCKISNYGLNPFGYGKSDSELRDNCSSKRSGLFCSQYYLNGGKYQ